MAFDSLELQASKTLRRAFLQKPQHIAITGSDSPLSMAALLAEQFLSAQANRQYLVLVPAQHDAEDLIDHLQFFAPEIPIHLLKSFDVSPYSGLYPNTRHVSERVGWCYKALISEPGIFLATPESLFQTTIPKDELQRRRLKIDKDEELPPMFRQWLEQNGYTSSSFVEEVGTYSMRGGIIDVFSPQYTQPLRIELFGDQVESLRFFDPASQRSDEKHMSLEIIPAREILFTDETRQRAARFLKEDQGKRPIDSQDAQFALQHTAQGKYFPGAEFLLSFLFEKTSLPYDFLSEDTPLWVINPIEVARQSDLTLENFTNEYRESEYLPVRPLPQNIIRPSDARDLPFAPVIEASKVDLARLSDLPEEFRIHWNVHPLPSSSLLIDDNPEIFAAKIKNWKESGYSIFIGATTDSQIKRIQSQFSRMDYEAQLFVGSDLVWSSLKSEQQSLRERVHIIPREIHESLRFSDDHIIFLRERDLLGNQKTRRRSNKQEAHHAFDEAAAISFRDLKVGDNVIHLQHGVAVYQGLKVMQINGVDAEFLELTYKDNDRLYLPIYRINQIQKYSGGTTKILDRLGGKNWEKTKSKVKNRLREIAHDLLKLYAERKEALRPPVQIDLVEYQKFSDQFPYEETIDQLRAIDSIREDFAKPQPMDRLICGDVGFGKTEVAMRAAFMAAFSGSQVAILAPTTVLTFQHFENFKHRFRHWHFRIKALNRFVSPAEVRKTLQEMKEGKVDIVIGTHRLLSKDVSFKNLGLLVVDEEQKFGVTHKEKIRKLRTMVDTLAMSATPIPRTLNMSLSGLRDLTVINTAPVDRLPTRTFVTRFEEETIRKAMVAELERGGQIFFLHNRVQSIYSTADEIRALVPQAKVAVGHGQMDEDELEDTMVRFFKKEIDILVCTTIIESGIDIPNANTIFIDQAQNFGLSQLYQLRGRVGRSKQKAYCYLIIPDNRKLDSDAQERLKVIQENTALGSGLVIAQHDLELRGTGTLLGEEQSGQIGDVGYEMFLELLEEALAEARGEELPEKIEPEINLKIAALIPSDYIPDLRIRLSYYRRLSEIESPEDVERLEDELKDQFGRTPEPVLNLMGLMLIRALCKELGVKDLSAGMKNVSLLFSEKTPVSVSAIVQLAMKERLRYSLMPDNRFVIKVNQMDWPAIYDELLRLKSLLL